MCGGSGTRLWPLSRKSLPKQFLKCIPESDNSFLQNTYLRLQKVENIQSPILITNEEHRFIAAEQMREINAMPSAIILEPFGRNTAPAIALGSLMAKTLDKDPLLLVVPSDHLISDLDKFSQIIQEGIKYAEKGFIVTFGIYPKFPETGFGYIEAKDNLDFQNIKGVKIKKFLEKPKKEIAEELIKDRKYSWNSGIFLVKASILTREYVKYCPGVYSSCQEAISKSETDLDFQRINTDSFRNCEDISFDIAIMEKTKLGIVLPFNIEWSDVGSWDSIWKISKKDKFGNTLSGNVFAEKIKNCYLRSESKLVVGLGVEDLIVVETTDAILITKRDLGQRVKNLIDKMKLRNYEELTSHRKVYRPWGSYISIAEGTNWQVKRINVKCGQSLSLQKHKYRAEHWVVVSGSALVEVAGEKQYLNKNQTAFVPLGCKHRVSNPGNEELILIEVQSGSYLGEDDIIRYEDNYGRKGFSN